jgi:pre-mRNA-splicing factor ATP-dependent RNA helicase DHX38/PRP16
MDRAWYDLDNGYDDFNNPFANIPEEYTKKKEEKLMKNSVKRISAQQRQINKASYNYYFFLLLTLSLHYLG